MALPGFLNLETPPVPLNYDYLLMPAESAEAAQAAAQAIKPKMINTIREIAGIGSILIDVKEKIPHGHWLPWLKTEFSFSDRTARNYMKLHSEYGGKLETVSNLNLGVVYKLIAAPQSARDELDALPEPASPTEVKRIIATHKPPKPDQAYDPTATIDGEVLPPEPDAAGQHTPRGTCRICKRPLTSADSVANGMGNVCAAHAARDADIEDAKANAHPTVTATLTISRERWEWLCDEVFNRGGFADWIDEDFAAIEQAFAMAKITEKITT